MSGIEDIQQDPPDPPIDERDDYGNDPGKEEITQPVDPVPAADSSDASSMTCSWTLLDKDEEDGKKKPESESGSSLEVLDQNDIRDRPQETDSDSIVTLSDDEILVAQSHAYCYIPDHVDGRTQESLISTISTVSVTIDGIPIKSQDDEDEEAGTQYDWNSEEEREIFNDRMQEIQPSSEHESEHGEENEPDDEDDGQESEGVGHLEPGEPGYDLDDDGLPGAPLPPLPQEVELYPSQELDPSYQAIQKEKVYKHDKNLQVDHFLTAILVLALALVIGLGIGHFLGLSERLEVQEMYDNLQEERLDNLQEDLVLCIEGDEGHGGDDQDLDDRVIKKLWEENQELRDQVYQMKSYNPKNDEAMAAILRDKINELLTANADLEREVARLRYADAARGAAESVETLDKLRKTRDTLNDIVTENDQLKIEVGKARYGEPFAFTKNYKEERELLAAENHNLKEKIKMLLEQTSNPTLWLSKIDFAFRFLQERTIFEPLIESFTTNFKMVQFDLPWPSKRKEELNKNSDGPKYFNSKDSDNNFQTYLAELLEMFSKDGTIDLKQSEKLVDGLKATLVVNFQDKIMSEKDLAAVLSKFDDLKKFVNGNLMSSNMKSLKIASLKFLKSLLGAVRDIKEANEENSGKSWFKNKFAEELSEVKEELNSKWNKIFKKWKTVTAHDYSRGEDDVDDEDDEDRHPMNKNKEEYKGNDQRKKKQSNIDDNDYAGGHISKDGDNYYQKDKLYKRNHERKRHKGKHEKRDN